MYTGFWIANNHIYGPTDPGKLRVPPLDWVGEAEVRSGTICESRCARGWEDLHRCHLEYSNFQVCG
jgi:hypothetical protein